MYRYENNLNNCLYTLSNNLICEIPFAESNGMINDLFMSAEKKTKFRQLSNEPMLQWPWVSRDVVFHSLYFARFKLPFTQRDSPGNL